MTSVDYPMSVYYGIIVKDIETFHSLFPVSRSMSDDDFVDYQQDVLNFSKVLSIEEPEGGQADRRPSVIKPCITYQVLSHDQVDEMSFHVESDHSHAGFFVPFILGVKYARKFPRGKVSEDCPTIFLSCELREIKAELKPVFDEIVRKVSIEMILRPEAQRFDQQFQTPADEIEKRERKEGWNVSALNHHQEFNCFEFIGLVNCGEADIEMIQNKCVCCT